MGGYDRSMVTPSVWGGPSGAESCSPASDVAPSETREQFEERRQRAIDDIKARKAKRAEAQQRGLTGEVSCAEQANSTDRPVPAVPEIPVMVDSTGEPLLLYVDGDGAAGCRLSAAAAAQATVRLLFLDVDGVLNNKAYTPPVGKSSCEVLLPECLAELRRALESTCAYVVLSSTWRSDSEQCALIVETLEQMRPGCVVGQTPQDPSYRNDMRPAEIANFLEQPVVADVIQRTGAVWCAVDDMDLVRQAEGLKKNHAVVKRLLPALQRGFVKTDKEVGLDEAGVVRIQQALMLSIADVASQTVGPEEARTRTRKKSK